MASTRSFDAALTGRRTDRRNAPDPERARTPGEAHAKQEHVGAAAGTSLGLTSAAGAGTASGGAEIVLDISRLVSRVLHPTPTGVDRVELMYARELLRRVPDRIQFAAVHPFGPYGRIPLEVARHFIEATAATWEGSGGAPARGDLRKLAVIASTLVQMRPRRLGASGSRKVLLQASPHHLHDTAKVRAILKREGASLVCLLHDLIPITHPEYARPGGDLTHRKRMHTVASLASGVVANSQATLTSFQEHVGAAGRDIPAAVAHLGVEPARVSPPLRSPARPYFISLGTIEPRKNHLLLLNLWRSLSERFGPDAIPKLLIIGRRGWENEQVIDMLDRCTAIHGCVEEMRRLPDRRVRELLAGASGLLIPSFAEGYGMPVPEALALGVPVVCSDLPAFREAGGDAPIYLDPLDGKGWLEAIRGLADTAGIERARHLARVAGWTPPSWDNHISVVLDMVERVAR